MIYTRRQLLRASLACSLWPLTACNRNVAGLPKEKITQTYPMKTYAVGRFLIDLPEVAKDVSLSQRCTGMNVIWEEKSEAQFKFIVNQKRLSLSGMDGKEPILIKDEPGSDPNTHIFLFKQVSPETGLLEVNVYRYSSELKGYHLFTSPIDPERAGEALPYANKVVRAVQPRLITTAMSDRGACFDHAFVSGADPAMGEEASIMAQFNDIRISFSTQVTDKVDDGPSLLKRAERLKGYPDIKILRKTTREVAGLNGEEVAFKTPTDSEATSHSFQWECQGKPNSIAEPRISAALNIPSGTDAASINNEELLGLWDAVLGSIRLRPGAV
jgi:hypothetical protein